VTAIRDLFGIFCRAAGLRRGFAGRRRHRRAVGRFRRQTGTLPNSAVVAIFDREIRPSNEDGPGDFCPLLAHLLHGIEQHVVQIGRPLVLVQLGSQVIRPPISTLLAHPPF